MIFLNAAKFKVVKEVMVVGRKPVQNHEVPPEWEGKACMYITAHVSRRLDLRFGIQRLKQTPFVIHTLYCEPADIDRPVWAIRIGNGKTNGYILGRWELADPEMSRGVYQHWFVATTAITDDQFKNSKLVIQKTVKVKVVRIITELNNPPWARNPDSK